MTIRTFARAPDAVVDPATGLPRYGSYVGHIPRVDLSSLAGGRVRRIAREKRWVYVAFASDEVFAAVAIARFGYASTCFGYVLEARPGQAARMLATASVLAPPTACTVDDGMGGDGTGEGRPAAFHSGKVRATVARVPGASAYSVDVALREIEIHATVDTRDAPPPITAVAHVGGLAADPLVSTTEKRALLAVRGDVTVGGKRRSLDGALAGYDYTHGLLPRHTAWRWAFALGRATSGECVAFNLVQGFVGEPECAAWVDGEVFALREGRFSFDRDQPLAEWRVSTADGAVDLRFKPGGMHAEHKNLGLVASRFVQPAGAYFGTIRVGGKELVLDGVLGVTEDQDVVW